MFRQAEVAVPSRHKHHVVTQVLPLDLCFLENYDVGFEEVEHGLLDMLVHALSTDLMDIRLRRSSCLSMVDKRMDSCRLGLSMRHLGRRVRLFSM